MRESLRGALLSVLFFGGMVLLAAVPSAAQGTPDNMECDGMDCSDSTTVTATAPKQQGQGIPWGWGPVIPQTPAPPPPPPPPPPPQGDQALTPEDWAEIDRLFGELCQAIRDGENAGTIIATILAIAKRSPVTWVIVKGSLEAAEASCALMGK